MYAIPQGEAGVEKEKGTTCRVLAIRVLHQAVVVADGTYLYQGTAAAVSRAEWLSIIKIFIFTKILPLITQSLNP